MGWRGEEGIDWLAAREESMKSVNPRFVLRQWVLQEVIDVCQEGDLQRSRAVLGKVLQVSALTCVCKIPGGLSDFVIIDGNLSIPPLGW